MKNLLSMSSLSTLALTLALAWPGRAAAEPPPYEIQKTPGKAAPGGTGTASLTVVARNGWHVNEQAPISVSLKGDPGIELPKAKMSRGDLAESTKEKARFDIPFSATTEGKKNITAEAKFVMCMAEACKPVKETVALEVDVAAAAPAKPEGKADQGKTGKAGGKRKAPAAAKSTSS
jgi:hypothetical protein